MLPSGLVRLLKSLRDALQEYIISKSRILTAIYYALCTGAFHREFTGVMRGRLMYVRHGGMTQGGLNYRFRRNLHRLEKGLLSVPRRASFGLSYIDETVEHFCRQVQQTEGDVCSVELLWGADVLKGYFSAVEGDRRVEKARSKFQAAVLTPGDAIARVPYKYAELGQIPVRYEDLLQLARRRHSVRHFRDKTVDRGLIERALAVAAQSPSGCNRQPFAFRLFDDPGMVHRLVELATGMEGFGEVIPVMAVVVGQLRGFEAERDRHLIYIDASLAAMALMLALETLGLSTCAINWPDLLPGERKVARMLGLEPDERVVMLMAVGYADPDGLIAFSQKKPVAQIGWFPTGTARELE